MIHLNQDNILETDNRDLNTTWVRLKDLTWIEVDIQTLLDLVKNAIENNE